MKRAVFIVLLLLACPAFAFTASNEALVAAGGIASDSAYSTYVSLSDGMLGPAATLAGTADVTGPTISYIYFDGRSIKNNDYVKPSVVITSRIVDDSSGVSATLSTVEVDSSSFNFSSSANGTSFSSDVLTYRPSFTNGTHTFKIYASDAAGNVTASSQITFKVDNGDAKITGAVLNYKNPFNPGIGETTSITYILNNDADVGIYIYNLVGQLIKKISCSSGSEGGHAGYNQVAWDGYSDFKEMVGNDVYLTRVVTGGKVIGKCKIAVLK